MKVALTGASGFLGRAVVARLRQLGCETVALGRTRPIGDASVVWLNVDLLNRQDVEATMKGLGASHLMHLAWYTEHGEYWESPVNRLWVDASLHLLAAFHAQGGQHVVMAGSCAEYDWKCGRMREDGTPLVPRTLYGRAKDETRRLSQAVCTALDMRLAWAHLFFPFGPGEARRRLIPSLVDVFRGRAPPFGVNAASWRSVLPVDDAAAALVHLLLGDHSGRFNICPDYSVRIGDLVRELADLCGADPRPVLELACDRADDPAVLVGHHGRLYDTRWRPVFT